MSTYCRFMFLGRTTITRYNIRSHLKIKILVQDPPLKTSGIKKRGRVLTRPVCWTGSSTGILKYVEDLKRGANAEVGPKDYFEMASNMNGLGAPKIFDPRDIRLNHFE